MKVGDYLTQRQTDRLPIGSVVEIVWSGGNGPHEYKIHSHRIDGRSACACYPDKHMRCYLDPIELVTLPPTPLTTVKLVRTAKAGRE